MTDDNKFRILIASDIHAGYGEKKKIIDNDSFVGLEETLKHATDEDVDFILLGGDLFHESIPSRFTEHKVITLLHKYCLNDRAIPMEFCSDPEEVFENCKFKRVNYEDPNINVGMPIFSIHGNHDDFSGKGLMALDILHDAGLLNLFGKFTDIDKIVVKPVLLKKGDTKVALYGIGSQRDDRLQRAFNAGKVKFCFPPNVDEWFNILVVHQNRPPRSTTRSTGAYLPLSVLPSQMDLIIWGHEHKSEIVPQFYDKGTGNPNDSFLICQPGSTVATSICTDETFAKHVGVLEITKEKKWEMIPIPLQRTRQIILEELDLSKFNPKSKLTKIKARANNMEDEQLIHQKLEEMLQKAEIERGELQPLLPRMRLKVIYSGEWLKIPPINKRIIGNRYEGKVANPSDLIIIKTINPEKDANHESGESLHIHDDDVDDITVHDLLKQSLTKNHVESGLGLIALDNMEVYVNTITRASEAMKVSMKTKFEILDKSVNEQISNYKNIIDKIPLTSVNNEANIDAIRGTIDKAVKAIKDKNRAEVATVAAWHHKKEIEIKDEVVEDSSNQQNNFDVIVIDDDDEEIVVIKEEFGNISNQENNENAYV